MSERATLLPHEFCAATLNVHVTNPEGKLMLTALKLFGPLTDAPPVAVQRYADACATGMIE
jgi:hypothetical protein